MLLELLYIFFLLLLLWVGFQKTLREIYVPRKHLEDRDETVLTFNIKKFPWSWKSFASPEINRLIRQHSIVCLQECFDEALHALEHYFPHYYISRGTLKGWKLFNSGLVILSKYPILEAEFHPYRDFNRCSCDMLSEKGFLSILIDMGKKGQVRIINTHLQSSDYERFDKKAILQMTQLLNYLRTVRVPYIVGGDFNIDVHDMDKLSIIGEKNCSYSKDPTVYIDFKNGTTSAEQIDRHEPLRFDYFIHSGLLIERPMVIKSSFSDHQAVGTRYEIMHKEIEKDVI